LLEERNKEFDTALMAPLEVTAHETTQSILNDECTKEESLCLQFKHKQTLFRS
jgi:hypothetical protein